MAEEEAEVKEEKPKSSIVPIILAGIVCLAAGLGGGYALFGQGGAEASADGEEKQEDGEVSASSSVTPGEDKETPKIAELGNQVLNLNDPLGARRLSLSISIEAAAAVVPIIEEKAPQIKSEIIMLAASYSADQLNGLDGKMNFRDEVQIRINGVLEAHKVEQVYFTEFLVQ